MKRIAVIGAGISGLAAAYLLSRRHRVWLFEQDSRLGGHTHTVIHDGLALDTGFLVHNARTYPLLVRLFEELGVETRDSDMCFAVADAASGLEYSSRGARGFFAQRRNLLSLAHLRLLREIVRFNRVAPSLLTAAGADALTLGDFLDQHQFGEAFTHGYLFPMASAVWSCSLDSIRTFPALTLIRFFENHGMLGLNTHPTWRTVCGGSHSYIPGLIAPLADRVIAGVSIERVLRAAEGVSVICAGRVPMTFDEVVFACHGDQVLPLLPGATDRERDVLGSFETTVNQAWLHTDRTQLPRLPDAQASWNYRLGASGAPPTVTYHLNRLQGIERPEQYCVTLNPGLDLDERAVLRKLVYTHPLYTRAAIAAQARWAEISGANRTHYCGAYWFYGFHEDGLRSALRVARALGVEW